MESMFSSNRPGWAALLDEKVTAYLPDLKYIHDDIVQRRITSDRVYHSFLSFLFQIQFDRTMVGAKDLRMDLSIC